MSTPISERITRATVLLTPGIVVSRSAASERAEDLVGLMFDLLHLGSQRVELRQVQLQQETMMRCDRAVHRGGGLCTTGL